MTTPGCRFSHQQEDHHQEEGHHLVVALLLLLLILLLLLLLLAVDLALHLIITRAVPMDTMDPMDPVDPMTQVDHPTADPARRQAEDRHQAETATWRCYTWLSSSLVSYR